MYPRCSAILSFVGSNRVFSQLGHFAESALPSPLISSGVYCWVKVRNGFMPFLLNFFFFWLWESSNMCKKRKTIIMNSRRICQRVSTIINSWLFQVIHTRLPHPISFPGLSCGEPRTSYNSVYKYLSVYLFLKDKASFKSFLITSKKVNS